MPPWWHRRPGQRVPSVLMHNWAVKRVLKQKIEAALDAHATGRLIDVGCGLKPHKRFLADRVSEHVGIDLEDCMHGTSAVDRVGTAYETGEPDGKADTVLLTQVFEHLEEPSQALRESFRILARVGGSCCRRTSRGTCTRSRATFSGTPRTACATCSSMPASRCSI